MFALMVFWGAILEWIAFVDDVDHPHIWLAILGGVLIFIGSIPYIVVAFKTGKVDD
jgi:hypothetical protein